MTSSLPAIEFHDDPSYPNLIELRDVTQVYETDRGPRTVLDNVKLLVEDKGRNGQVIMILGPSGCGKSTLLRYIAGLQRPTRGEVHLKGKLRTDHDLVGMVFQQYSSFEWRTALQNVMFGLELRGVDPAAAEARAREMLAKVELTAQADQYAKYPDMSGGQLQRVAIARSLVVTTDTLLMDEPYGALDTNTRYRQQLLLAGLREQYRMTVIMVTHDVGEAVFLGDDVYIMSANPGRIVSHLPIDLGPHRDRALKRSARYQEYHNELEDRMIQLDAISASKPVNP